MLNVWSVSTSEKESIVSLRVGIYDNPPKVFRDKNNEPSGFFVDLLNAIAHQQKWELIYQDCIWEACLFSLETGELDLMVDIAYSTDRLKRFDLNHEVVIASWSVIYARPGIPLYTIPDLDQKRVAVVKQSIQYENLKKLAQEFGVSPFFLEVTSFEAVFKAIEEGEAEAGLVNRFFGVRAERKFRVNATSLLLNPSQLHFATPKGKHPEIIAVIDRELLWMKQDPDSAYYHALARWLSVPGIDWTLIFELVGAMTIVSSVFISFLIYRHSQKLSIEIHDRQRIEQQLLYNALHDSLTDLGNRTLLMSKLEENLDQVRQDPDYLFGVLFLDLDRFKLINDGLGHLVGDQLLLIVADKIRKVIRPCDVAARLGGDEFIILLTGLREPDEATGIAAQLIENFREAVVIDQRTIVVTASIGLVLGNATYRESVSLIRDADLAMYQAKLAGKNQYALFNQNLHKAALKRLQLEQDLRYAIDQQSLLLYYQPIFLLKTGELNGFEALIRWNHPYYGFISPDEFIPIAEETGLIQPLTYWIVAEACRQLKEWHQCFAHRSHLRMGINLSPADLKDDRILQVFDQVLAEIGLTGSSLTLELTERMLIDISSPFTEWLFTEFKSRGVRISIDDFGTGYSCLSYLHQLPVDDLKIDRSFIHSTHPQNRRIAETIVALTQQMGLTAIAEGIETLAELQWLQNIGCELGQGYFLAHPLNAQSATEFIR